MALHLIPSMDSLQLGSKIGEGLEGYDHDFVPSLDNKYMCPICLLALRDPVQTECGHRFCQPCILRSLEHKKRCPVDNVPLTEGQLFRDKYAHREILDLTVKCKNKGCDFVSELRVIESHAEKCKMRKTPCKNLCGLMLLVQDAVYHEENQCPRRPVMCEVCGQTYPFSNEEQHKEECKENLPVKCPHCSHELKQYKLHSHMNSECLQAPINCVFARVGCLQKLPRHDIQKHMEQSTQIHLQFLLNSLGQLTKGNTDLSELVQGLGSRIDVLEKETPALDNSSSREIYMGQMTNGYPDSSIAPRDSMHSGESELDEIDRIKEQNHLLEAEMSGALDNEASALQHSVLTEEVEQKIVRLDHHVRELMAKMDTQVSSIRELTSKLRCVEQKIANQELRCCNGIYYWKIQEYSRLRRAAATGDVTVLHSPGFYTSLQGYRFCVRVNLNGVENAQGTHLSLFVHLMKGENDELLTWPFAGVIMLTVINQRDRPEERSHISETLTARSNLMAFQKPTSERNQKGYGYIDFFPLNMLESEGFVRSDTLIIKAQVYVDQPLANTHQPA